MDKNLQNALIILAVVGTVVGLLGMYFSLSKDNPKMIFITNEEAK